MVGYEKFRSEFFYMKGKILCNLNQIIIFLYKNNFIEMNPKNNGYACTGQYINKDVIFVKSDYLNIKTPVFTKENINSDVHLLKTNSCNVQQYEPPKNDAIDNIKIEVCHSNIRPKEKKDKLHNIDIMIDEQNNDTNVKKKRRYNKKMSINKETEDQRYVQEMKNVQDNIEITNIDCIIGKENNMEEKNNICNNPLNNNNIGKPNVDNNKCCYIIGPDNCKSSEKKNVKKKRKKKIEMKLHSDYSCKCNMKQIKHFDSDLIEECLLSSLKIYPLENT